MNNVKNEINKTIDQLKNMLQIFQDLKIQEEPKEKDDDVKDPPPAEQFPVHAQDSRSFQVNLQANYLQNSASPAVKNCVDMFLLHGFEEETCNALVNLYATSVWRFSTTLSNYGIEENNVQKLGITHLQNWDTLCTLFNNNRVFLTSPVSGQDFLKYYVRVIFPVPDKTMVPDFVKLLTKKTRRNRVDAHIAYMFIVCNLINNGSMAEAVRFQTMLETCFLGLISFVPKIGKDYKWVIRKVGASDQGMLHFVPHQK